MGAVVDEVAAVMDRRDVAVWVSLFAAGLLFEVRELAEGERGVPLSRVLRAMFRTEHPVGAAAFKGTVLVGGLVLVRHICERSSAE